MLSYWLLFLIFLSIYRLSTDKGFYRALCNCSTQLACTQSTVRISTPSCILATDTEPGSISLEERKRNQLWIHLKLCPPAPAEIGTILWTRLNQALTVQSINCRKPRVLP